MQVEAAQGREERNALPLPIGRAGGVGVGWQAHTGKTFQPSWRRHINVDKIILAALRQKS